MNKACFLPLVFATVVASVAFADTYTDQYTNVFTGVTGVSAAGVPSATGGSWTTGGVVLTNVDNKVAFEADDAEVLKMYLLGECDTLPMTFDMLLKIDKERK